MQEIDADRDGCVTYDEFVPICFDLLVELLKDELLEVPPLLPGAWQPFLKRQRLRRRPSPKPRSAVFSIS